MNLDLLVPDIGDFENVEIIEVLVKKGDKINKNDPVVTLESDKSSVEVPSNYEGTIENINVKKEKKINDTKKQTSTNKDNYSIVVGTFKYRKSAEKQINLIKSKYPITTSSKESKIVFIEVSGKKLYESRFLNFSKKDAYQACRRLAKYGRDCFVRL